MEPIGKNIWLRNICGLNVLYCCCVWEFAFHASVLNIPDKIQEKTWIYAFASNFLTLIRKPGKNCQVNGLFLPVAKPKLLLGSVKAFLFRTLTPYSQLKAGSSQLLILLKPRNKAKHHYVCWCTGITVHLLKSCTNKTKRLRNKCTNFVPNQSDQNLGFCQLTSYTTIKNCRGSLDTHS